MEEIDRLYPVCGLHGVKVWLQAWDREALGSNLSGSLSQLLIIGRRLLSGFFFIIINPSFVSFFLFFFFFFNLIVLKSFDKPESCLVLYK